MPEHPPQRGESAEPGDGLDERAFAVHARFRHALRTFLRFSEQAARRAGLTPEQHQLLLAIRGSGRPWLLVGEVATELLIAPHSALGLIERAVAAGLVSREQDPGDHRKVRVSLTPLAQQLVAELTLAHRAELRRLWDQIPPPQ